MIVNGVQLTAAIGLSLIAGVLMSLAGMHKRVLRWKPADRRCATCGRRRSRDCACKR